MKKALIIIDMQNDFVYGALANKNAQKIVDPIVEKIQSFNGDIIATRDTHYENYLDTAEGKALPIIHCLIGTDGWKLVPKINNAILESDCNRCYLDKEVFGLANKKSWDLDTYEEVEIVGTCTDICVISNALILKALYPNLKIKVLSNLCAGLTAEKHQAALEVMKSCQIEVI